MTLFTTTLGAGESIGPLTATMHIQYISVQMSGTEGDSGTVLGSAVSPIDNSTPSSAANIGAGGGVVFQDVPGRPLQGVTISCIAGTMNVIIGF